MGVILLEKMIEISEEEYFRLKQLEKENKTSNIRGRFYNVFHSRKSKSLKTGREFTIQWEDIVIPTHCPVLGFELTYDAEGRDQSPSLDRIDNSKGYIEGNVRVISSRANVLRKNGTLEEFEKIVEDLRKLKNAS